MPSDYIRRTKDKILKGGTRKNLISCFRYNALHSSNFSSKMMVLDKKVEKLRSTRSNPLHSIYKMPRERGNKAEALAFLIGGTFLVIGFTIPAVAHGNHDTQNITTQVGFLLWLGIVFIIAELIRRFCLLAEELCHVNTLYSGSLSRLVLHVFGSRTATIFASSMILLSFLFICILEPKIVGEINPHWSFSLGIAGMYLILISVVKIGENLVDCDVLLDERLLAIGHGLAYSYYYGFLKIILPPGPTERGQVKSLPQRATDLECEQQITLHSNKLLVLIPDTCFCHPSFQDMAPGQIEFVKKLEDVIIARAGMKSRPYSASVYRILPEGRTTPIYVMLEMPAILYVLYEMNTVGHHHSKLSAFERTKQAQSFTRILHRLLENDPSCRDMYEIIYYKDQDVNLAELIYEHVKRR